MSIDRRTFLKATGATAASGLAMRLPTLATACKSTIRETLIPVEKGITAETLARWRERGQRRVYRGNARYTIGMPVGGIGAGQVYVLGDGTLGGWHVDGRRNATGYGAHNYQTTRASRNLAQGFHIETTDGSGRKRSAVLSDRAFGGDFDDIEFVGEYPVAMIRYRHGVERRGDEGRGPLPQIDVGMEVFSPFCPLDTELSSLPCTMIRMHVRNTGSQSLRCRVTGWLENGVQRDAIGQAGAPAYRARVIRDARAVAVMMDAISRRSDDEPTRPERVLQDFNGPNYGNWVLQGRAFGEFPAKGTQPTQQRVSGFEGEGLVNSYLGSDEPTGRLTSPEFRIDRRFLTFLIGGGAHARQTCMNLLVDGRVVRSATGKNNERLEPFAWDISELEGQSARLEIVDEAAGAWGHINIDRIALADALPASMQRPNETDLTFGSMAIAALDRDGAADPSWTVPHHTAAHAEPFGADRESVTDEPGTGAVACEFDLAPLEEHVRTFVVAWHFPNLHTNERTHYATRFDDALEVVRYVTQYHRRLHEVTELFRRTVYDDTTLPYWLVHRLFMPVSTLATGTCQWWANGRFWGWEGVGCCHGTCTHVWNYSHAEARLFPELARSTRKLQDLGTAFEESTGRVAFRGDVDGGFEYAADGQAGTVLKMYREHLCSRDDTFLRANWPRTRKVIEFLIMKDEETRPGFPMKDADGIIVGSQHNTFDINFEGPNTFVGSLYLAALLAGAAMADRMGEKALAERYRALADQGARYSEIQLFNGEYFGQVIPEDASDRFQYGEGCLADQMFGQQWARSLDLGSVFDESKSRSALLSVYRYNFAPSVGPYNAEFPPERVFARDREGGVFTCTWPRKGRPDVPVRYRDEVWTGIEYQVAAGLLWEGCVNEALAIVHAVDDRYDGVAHNPWNEVECGDHYARAMASFGTFQALCGFVYDGPNGRIGIAPRLNTDHFAAFFVAAEGWGTVRQTRTADQLSQQIDLKWGRLLVREYVIDSSDDAPPKDWRATVDQRMVAAKMIQQSDRLIVTFDEPVELEADSTLALTWSRA